MNRLKSGRNLVNIGDEPVTVMKTIHIFTNSLSGLWPMVNGKLKAVQVTAFDKGDPSDNYVMLLPKEGVLIRIPDFLSVFLDLDGQPRERSTGQFEFAMQYKNWIPYILNEFVFPRITRNRILYQVYSDRPVWTGILESNSLTITIVEDAAKCSPTT